MQRVALLDVSLLCYCLPLRFDSLRVNSARLEWLDENDSDESHLAFKNVAKILGRRSD